MRKIVLYLLISLFLVCRAEAANFKAVMVTDVAGLGDKSFNDAAWRGLAKAKQDLGIEIAVLQSAEQADYISNLNLAAQDGQAVVAMGFYLEDAVIKVAPLYPKHSFIFIDGCIKAPNVASYLYKSEEGAYLAGILAAAVSSTGVVGIVEGDEIPPVKVFEAGFKAGILTANSALGKQVKVRVASAGDFNNPAKGKSLAQSLAGQQADIIFQLAGNTGLGVFEWLKNAPAKHYAIGSDLDQDGLVPGRVLTSVLKRTEAATYQAIKSAKQGKFTPGCHRIGLASGAVDISGLKHTRQLVSPQALKLLDKARQMIISQQLRVPDNLEGVKAFVPPSKL